MDSNYSSDAAAMRFDSAGSGAGEDGNQREIDVMKKGLPSAKSMCLVVSVIMLGGCARTVVEDDTLSFALPNVKGETVTLEDDRFRGNVVMVDIWGSWCPPCLEQIPHLVALQDKYRSEGFEVIGVDFEAHLPDDRDMVLTALNEFAADHSMNYTVLLGGTIDQVEQKLDGLTNFKAFPTSIFIGRDGRVRDIDVGFYPGGAKDLERKIVKFLQEGEG